MDDQKMPDGSDELFVLELAFAEGVRKLASVHDAAESVRTRAGTLMAVATAVGAFIGGLAVDRAPEGLQWTLAAAGLASYLAALAVLVSVVLPKKDAWPVGQNTTVLAGIAGTEDRASILRHLAIAYQDAFTSGQAKIRTMARSFKIGVGLMVMELLFFSCLLGLASQNQALSAENPVRQPPVSTTLPAVSTTQP